MQLNPKARLAWCAHLFKACTKQHHRELRAPLSQLIDADAVILEVGQEITTAVSITVVKIPSGAQG